MGCNRATKVGMIEITFPRYIYFESQLYSFQTFTGVVDLHFSFWLQPQVWSASFYYFGPDHRCGLAPFLIFNKTTVVVDLLFTIWRKQHVWTASFFSI